jgi:hypothetical protein
METLSKASGLPEASYGEGKPLFAVECPAGEKNPNPSLYYFMERMTIPKFYQLHGGKGDSEKNGDRVLPVQAF